MGHIFPEAGDGRQRISVRDDLIQGDSQLITDEIGTDMNFQIGMQIFRYGNELPDNINRLIMPEDPFQNRADHAGFDIRIFQIFHPSIDLRQKMCGHGPTVVDFLLLLRQGRIVTPQFLDRIMGQAVEYFRKIGPCHVLAAILRDKEIQNFQHHDQIFCLQTVLLVLRDKDLDQFDQYLGCKITGQFPFMSELIAQNSGNILQNSP